MTINYAGSGSGSATKSPNQSSYAHGTVVALTANPNTGSSFVSWSGDLSGNTNPATITMDGAKSVTATFAQNPSGDVLFADGFESGGFGAWSGSTVSSGETATVNSVGAYSGTYGAVFVFAQLINVRSCSKSLMILSGAFSFSCSTDATPVATAMVLTPAAFPVKTSIGLSPT